MRWGPHSPQGHCSSLCLKCSSSRCPLNWRVFWDVGLLVLKLGESRKTGQLGYPVRRYVSKDRHLGCLLVFLQPLEEGLAYGRCSVNICCMNNWVLCWVHSGEGRHQGQPYRVSKGSIQYQIWWSWRHKMHGSGSSGAVMVYVSAWLG